MAFNRALTECCTKPQARSLHFKDGSCVHKPATSTPSHAKPEHNYMVITHTDTCRPPGREAKEHLHSANPSTCVTGVSPGRPPSFSFPDNRFPRNALESMSCEALASLTHCGVSVSECNVARGTRQRQPGAFSGQSHHTGGKFINNAAPCRV